MSRADIDGEREMPIIVAKYAGYCFGVKRAVDKVYDLIENNDGNTGIYTLGHLIHNSHFLRELESKGVETTSEEKLEELAMGASETNKVKVIIRAHGTTLECESKLIRCSERNPYFSYEDCTCLYVKTIHRIVEENSAADILTVIIGDADHPEVIGIKSRAKGDTIIADTCTKLEESAVLNGLKKGNFEYNGIILVAQTTQKLTEWKKCQNYIRKLYTNAKIFDTICSVTEKRQTEVNSLSKQVDMMLIIGDRESSNTTKLYLTAKKNLNETYLIEDASELKKTLNVMPHLKVGVAAGASASGSIIEEVIKTMSEEIKAKAAEIENFADMLEEGYLETIKSGQTVKGTIISIAPNELHVDLRSKVTGVIAFDEITDDSSAKLEEMFEIGQEIVARVIKVSDIDGVATLSKKQNDSVANWNKIVEAYNNADVLEGKIVEAVKSGVLISLDGVRVFIPASQSGVPKSGDLNTLIGTTQRVKIIDLNEQRRRAVASIRAVAKEEQKAKEADFWANIEKNKKYEGVVKSLTSYGAFVDLGGVDGMVHSTELSWKRIKHPSEVVAIGDTINVYVKDFDPESKRISLGYKTEETNPWNVFLNTYSVGDVAKVKIVSLMDFGAFAEVVPGTDGLIHISQIADRKIDKPSDVLEVGQEVDAKIIDIDTEKRKISLSIRALLEASAEEAEEAAEENN